MNNERSHLNEAELRNEETEERRLTSRHKYSFPQQTWIRQNERADVANNYLGLFNTSTLLVLFAACSFCCNVTWFWCQKEIGIFYVEAAMDMCLKMKEDNLMCSKDQTSKAIDCADVLQMGHNKSGVYKIWPVSRVIEGRPLNVYCDMDTDGGGWTVIQRRGDFDSPKDYFYQDWHSYKVGFGDIEKDFWLGNDNIFALTNQKLYSARFDLQDFMHTKRYATYQMFWINDEDHKYTLHIHVYSGNAGDSMTDHHNMAFTTKDRDHDNHKDMNCAVTAKGGWWYNGCHHSNLNGLYHKGQHESLGDGVNWLQFKGHRESLKWTEIKIRPRHFKVSSASEVIPI